MAIAVLVAALLLGAICWRRQRQQMLRHLRHIEHIIDEISAGRRPENLVFRQGRHLAGLPWRLEHLSDEYQLVRRQAEERTSDLEAILTSMVEGVLVVSERHVVRMANQSFCAMFGLAEAPVGLTILQSVRDAAIDRMIGDALAEGGVQSREITVSPSPRETRVFSANALPVKNAAGLTNGIVAVFHDVSRLHQLESVRREFVANVSHELRTPLSIFHGHLENLLDHPQVARGELVAVLKIMNKHSLRLNALLNDLLQLARMEARKETLNLGEVRLEAFLREFAPDWDPKLSEKKLTLALEIPPALPPVSADRNRLEQVFGNLLENAIKFSRDGGTITISARAHDRGVEIAVRDGGIGIPPADLPHIFERFYRVEKARSREAGGTGLGLSIVKHIVALHGGQVRAESPAGIGTTIFLNLPQASAEPER